MIMRNSCFFGISHRSTKYLYSFKSFYQADKKFSTGSDIASLQSLQISTMKTTHKYKI